MKKYEFYKFSTSDLFYILLNIWVNWLFVRVFSFFPNLNNLVSIIISSFSSHVCHPVVRKNYTNFLTLPYPD